ncbi:MAG: methionyl-tRNA formyltransferase [Alphaproteobacteria bacterium]|nr:methionyl-tRNA formyltransferase [Alphaproteobacteria bacterium]MCB9975785.1 methionyl-tRNA formyltransferase [Rhodospirillales bacterium]
MAKALRLAFMGTPDFAVPALDALYRSRHKVACVYSQPPRPKGRGQNVKPSPVHVFAQERDIPVRTPKTLKDKDTQTEFAALDLDVAVVAAYGLILPKEILEAPRHGCLNIHASLLPRWRGASPIQRAIWEGDKYSGVTIMQMDAGLDTGPMIDHVYIPLTEKTTASSLHDELAQKGGELLMKVLNDLAENGNLQATRQDDSKATYAHLLKKEDGQIDWTKDAASIDRQIRALNPWPGTWTTSGGRRFKIFSAACTKQSTKEKPGTIIDRLGDIACGKGTVLKILKLQPDGKQPMDFISALNGWYIGEYSKLLGT